MYMSGQQVTSESLSLNTANATICTIAYQTLANGLGFIQH